MEGSSDEPSLGGPVRRKLGRTVPEDASEEPRDEAGEAGLSKASDREELRAHSGGWLPAFVAVQFALQLLLLVPFLNRGRVVVRTAAFLVSAGLIVIFRPRRGQRTPLTGWALLILLVLAAAFLNIASTGVLASVAQFALYLAILAPIFWVCRLRVTPEIFRSSLLLLWGFYAASAFVGVLQVYFPGRFQPPLSAIAEGVSADLMVGMQIELNSGAWVFRPMGLTDKPGGAAYGGLYAVLFGTTALVTRSAFPLSRPFAVLSIVVGAMCLYLCQVRSLLVMTGISIVVLGGVLSLRGRFARVFAVVFFVTLGLGIGYVFAISLAGDPVTDRLATLTESDPGTVYYESRGFFLEDTIQRLLPLYPFGAGLGRWGMMSRYFGSPSDALWVEIQWTGWLLDGGVPLIIAYCGAILTACWASFRVALESPSRVLAGWAPAVVAYNIGALALCFNYPVFIGTAGLEFWLLNAGLLQASRFANHRVS